MNDRRVLFQYPVCGKRVATLLDIVDGKFCCQIGNWLFWYEGKARELMPDEEMPTPTVVEPMKYESRIAKEVDDAWKGKHLDVQFGILDKVKTQCKCGCGGETLSLFVPGHDMRVKGMIVKMTKGLLKLEDVPDITRELLTTEPKWVLRMKDANLL